MKKNILAITLFMLMLSSMHAQLHTLPGCNPTGSTAYGPMYSTSSANSTSRTAVIYPSSQLGEIAGEVLTGLYFNRSTSGISMTGTPNFKIYVKETTATDFGPGALDWADAITGATLMYDSNPATLIGTTGGWRLFPLSTNFTYSGTQNLAVFFEYKNPVASNALSWLYEALAPCVDVTNSNTTKYSNNTTGDLPATLTLSDYRRPYIGFDFVVSCNAPISVSTTNITYNSATISWVEPTIVPINGYEYYISTSNVAPISSTPATDDIPTGTTVEVSSLLSNTNYYVWVRSVCNAGDKSVWKAAAPFKTLCSEVAGFIETFDTTTAGTFSLPDCWSKLGTSANVYVATGALAQASVPNCLYISINATNTAFAVLPPLSNLQATTHRLRFKTYATAVGKILNLGYLTNPADESSFVLLTWFSVPGSTASTAIEFTYLVPALPAGVKHLVFTTPSGASASIYVDDVKWEINSPCVEPTQLSANQITNSSAQLSWVNGGPETAWEIHYGLNGFLLGTGTTVTENVTNPYVLSGLTANTTYQYYVRGVCTGPVSSAWSGPYKFQTQCNDQTDFIENFESYVTGSSNPMPTCWYKGGTGNTYLTTGSVAPMSPVKCLFMSANGTATIPTVAYAILPAVSNLNANTHRLRFKAYANSLSGSITVGYVTDITDVSTFVTLYEFVLPGTAATSALEFDFAPGVLPVGVKNLAFKNSGAPSTSSITVYIDDVRWEPIPTCIAPSGLTVNSITNTTVDLSWTQSGTPLNDWEIEFGAPGFAQGTGTIVSAPTNPFAVSGLTPNTNYTFYVRAVCSGTDSSYWSSLVAAKTLCDDMTEYVQTFEGYPVGTNSLLPDCWVKGGTGQSYLISGTTSPMSPVNRIYAYASGSQEAFVIMPPVSNLQANTHRLKFKAYATIIDRTLEIGYLTNSNDVSTFNFLESISLPSTSVANTQEFTFIPGALPVGVKCLVFRIPGVPSSSTTAYIDDVKWEAIPTCLESTDITVTGVSNSSVTLAWIEGDTATAWEIEYTPTLGTSTIVSAPTNPFTVTGLTATTNYTFVVRAVCSPTDSSPWSNPISYKTLCNEVTEFAQNFEGYQTGVSLPLADCWSKAGNGSSYLSSGSVLPMSPTNRLIMISSTMVTPITEAYVIMPPVSNLQAATHRLKFRAYASVADRSIEVGYLTNASDVSTFVFIQGFNLPSSAATVQEFTLLPSALPAGVKQLVFKNPAAPSSATTFYIDDVVWQAIPTCLEPSGLTINGITNTTATLSWTQSVAPQDGWQIEYGAPGFTPGTGTNIPVPTNPFTLAGLTPDTNYSFYVRAVCSATDNSYWTDVVTSRTLCNDVTEFTQNFEGYAVGNSNPLPDCWGRLGTSNTFLQNGITAPMSPTNVLYMIANGALNPPTFGIAVLPPVSNLSLATHQLKFKAYATALDRTLDIGYLTNVSNPSSFVTLTTINLPGTTVATSLIFTYAPPALPVGVKNLAIRNSGITTGSTVAYIDDVSWNAIPNEVPNCATNVVVTPHMFCGNYPTSFTWDATPGADGYKLSIGTTPGGTQVLNNVNIGPSSSYSFVGVNNTTYYYTLTPFSTAGDAIGCLESSFATHVNGCYCTSFPIGNDGQGITSVVVGTTNFTNPDVTYTDNTASPVSLEQGVTSPVVINFATGHAYKTYIWIDLNDNFVFDESELLYSGVSLSAIPTTLNATIAMPVSAPLGAHRMRLVTYDNSAIANACYNGNYGVTIDFTVNVIENSMSTGSFDTANFKYYPNPVTDVLTLSYNNPISEVVVYNLLGQQVLNAKPNATEIQMNLSVLNTGTYVVKIVSENQVKTIKVIKN